MRLVLFVRRIFRIRIIRYGLVGGIGIPVNLIALAGFLYIMGDNLYPLALACAFEVSTTVNFVLNQLFTYHEQKLRGWQWIKRAIKAQMTSISALIMTYCIALFFKYIVHANPYIASTIGIVTVFFYNFAISRYFVFRSVHSQERNTTTMQNTNGIIKNAMNNSVTPSSFAIRTVSVVIPVMNEQGNILPLFNRLVEALNQASLYHEIIFIDDGSTDQTFKELCLLHQQYPQWVRVVQFRKNFGKTPALVAGFARCRGSVIITMDGDLQDDPQEIPRFLATLDEGYDVVSGWKFPRLDPLSKTFPSRIFNWLVGKTTGVQLHDINCGFKAYRREIIEDTHLKLYGEFHRLIPIIAHWRGFKVTEIKVKHHPRTMGKSKFGGKRFARGLIDLTTVIFLTSFLHTPLRLFGKLGFWTFVLGVAIDAFVVWRSFAYNLFIHNQPLLLVGVLLMIFGFLFVVLGLLGEMIRYYSFQSNEEYSVKQEFPTQSDTLPEKRSVLRKTVINSMWQ